MMTLYHGSFMAVQQPLAKAGRDSLDFGKGFYLTSIQEQAKAWAVIMATRKGRMVNPVLNVYHFDYQRAKCDNIRIKEFPSYDLEWLDYVVSCRQGRKVFTNYDVVEGGVANDNVIDTVEDYEKGVVTAEQALGQLKYKKVNHQLCILSQSVIDKYLFFQESILFKVVEDKE